MIRSSSIYYALFLSTVIAVLLGSLVLFSAMNRQLSNHLEIENVLSSNSESGIQYGLAKHYEMDFETPLPLRLYSNGIDSVILLKKRWGAHRIIESTAVHGNLSNTHIALTGSHPSEKMPNLYVPDNGKPIVVCGDTHLEGNLLLPISGIKRGTIEGQNYSDVSLFYGVKSYSNKVLPEFQSSIIENLIPDSADFLVWDNTMDSVANSFTQRTQHYLSDSYIFLNDVYAHGNVILESKDSIIVGANAEIEYVILKSPVIVFQNGFKGNVQAFASKKITLEENSCLTYPSVLGIFEAKFPEKESASICFHSSSQMIGSVFLISQQPDFRFPVQLNMAEDSQIDGLVYCTGTTQLSGTVNGSLYTNGLSLTTPTSKYENHILNGKILNQLPEEFVFIDLLESNNELLTVITWLD
ncbi:MAG: hypothetical protein JNJ99_01820 [Crocinitomicaceae bacterium]|nr:hypothetical protein [Crocinitomicaceae bacterium]